jgi:voltage-gated potassium channel
LGRFFGKVSVVLSIGVLVLVSVLLTLIEFTIYSSVDSAGDDPRLMRLETVNDVITLIFVVELTLRFFAAPTKLRFFQEYWTDIIAVLPVFRIFRSVRILRGHLGSEVR